MENDTERKQIQYTITFDVKKDFSRKETTDLAANLSELILDGFSNQELEELRLKIEIKEGK